MEENKNELNNLFENEKVERENNNKIKTLDICIKIVFIPFY